MHMYMYVYMYTHTHTRTHTYTHTHTRTNTHTHTHTYVHRHRHRHRHMYTDTCTHTHTYTPGPVRRRAQPNMHIIIHTMSHHHTYYVTSSAHIHTWAGEEAGATQHATARVDAVLTEILKSQCPCLFHRVTALQVMMWHNAFDDVTYVCAAERTVENLCLLDALERLPCEPLVHV
jgi:hypothetical protein